MHIYGVMKTQGNADAFFSFSSFLSSSFLLLLLFGRSLGSIPDMYDATV